MDKTMWMKLTSLLGTLALLSGCVAGGVEESITRAAEGLNIEHNCGPVDFEEFPSEKGEAFPLFWENQTPDLVISNASKSRVLIWTSIYADRPACWWIISPSDDGGSTNAPIEVEELVLSQSDLRLNEMEIFEAEQRKCEGRGRRAMNLYLSAFSRPILIPVKGLVVGGRFTGCQNIVKFNVIGFKLNYGNNSYRVVLIMENLITSRELQSEWH